MSIETVEVLRPACQRVGFDDESAELIRDGENALYRLPCGMSSTRYRRMED